MMKSVSSLRISLTSAKCGRVLVIFRGACPCYSPPSGRTLSPSWSSSSPSGQFYSSSIQSNNTTTTKNSSNAASRKAGTSTVIRNSSTTSGDDNGGDGGSSSSSEYVTGKVRVYFRKKGYGFLVPDNPTSTDIIIDPNDPTTANAIFVHRSAIKSTQLLPSTFANLANPYLVRNERVRFRIIERINDAKDFTFEKVARDVEYEDGTPIPIYRSEYVDNVKKYHYSVLGEAVYTAMEEDENDDKDDDDDNHNNNNNKTTRSQKKKQFVDTSATTGSTTTTSTSSSSSSYAKILEVYEKVHQNIVDGQTRYDAMNDLIQKKN